MAAGSAKRRSPAAIFHKHSSLPDSKPITLHRSERERQVLNLPPCIPLSSGRTRSEESPPSHLVGEGLGVGATPLPNGLAGAESIPPYIRRSPPSPLVGEGLGVGAPPSWGRGLAVRDHPSNYFAINGRKSNLITFVGIVEKKTFIGIVEKKILPSPSCPKKLEPQQRPSPAVVSAQV